MKASTTQLKEWPHRPDLYADTTSRRTVLGLTSDTFLIQLTLQLYFSDNSLSFLSFTFILTEHNFEFPGLFQNDGYYTRRYIFATVNTETVNSRVSKPNQNNS